jgi:hypothetical protein
MPIALRRITCGALALAAALSGCGKTPRDGDSASTHRDAPGDSVATNRSAVSADPWPTRDLPAFVFAHLDLTTFPNSTDHEAGQRFFADFGIHPTESTDTTAISDTEEWMYRIELLGRRDYNRDGVVEVVVCFTDWARNGGTYRLQMPLILVLIGGRAIAIDYEIPTAEAAGCPEDP